MSASPDGKRVAFGAPYPGKILPMDLRALGGHLVCQKDSFLCAARGGSIGSAGATIVNGMVYVTSGYTGFQNGRPGNVLLAFAPSTLQ